MPDLANTEKGKFLVVEDEEKVTEFEDMEAARSYIQDEVDSENFSDTVVYRFTQKYKINTTKTVLFSKV